jgi:hypothetical protein
VLQGAFAFKGMGSFADRLSRGDAAVLHAFIVDQATQAYEAQEHPHSAPTLAVPSGHRKSIQSGLSHNAASRAALEVLKLSSNITKRVISLPTKAMRRKIERGEWVEGKVWTRAPDGPILISISGFEKWVGQPPTGSKPAAQIEVERQEEPPRVAKPKTVVKAKKAERTCDEVFDAFLRHCDMRVGKGDLAFSSLVL